jgi:hypothetical protein
LLLLFTLINCLREQDIVMTFIVGRLLTYAITATAGSGFLL